MFASRSISQHQKEAHQLLIAGPLRHTRVGQWGDSLLSFASSQMAQTLRGTVELFAKSSMQAHGELREVMSLRHCFVCRSPGLVQAKDAGSWSLHGQGEVTRLVMTWHWRADHRGGHPITEEYTYEPRIRAFLGSLRRRRNGNHTYCIHATLPPPPARDNDGDLDTSLPGALLERASDALCHFVLRHPGSCLRSANGPRSAPGQLRSHPAVTSEPPVVQGRCRRF